MPNRIDGAVLIAVIVTLVAFLWRSVMVYISPRIANAEENIFPILVLVSTVVIAVAACMGWSQWSRKRTLFLFAISVAAIGVPIAEMFYRKANSISTHAPVFQWWYFRGQNYFENSLDVARLVYIGASTVVGSFVATLLGVWLYRFVPIWILKIATKFGSNASNKISGKFEVTRVKLLVVAAILLMMIGVTNNILIANGFNIFKNSLSFESDWAEIANAVMLSVVAFGFLVVWPTWCILHGKKLWANWLAVTSLCAVLLFIVFAGDSGLDLQMPFWIEFSVVGVVGTFFLLTVVCLKPGADAHHKLPTIWSLVPIAIAVITFVSPWFADYTILLDPTRNDDMPDRWYTAVESANVIRKTNGSIRGYQNGYIGRFDSESKPNVLKHLDLSSPPTSITFVGPMLTVDTSVIRESGKQVSLFDAKLTAKQFEDVMMNSTGKCFWQNVDVDDSEGKAIVDSMSNIKIFDDRPGGVGRLLSSIESFTNKQQIMIHSDVTSDDWPAVVRASQTATISIFGRFPNEWPIAGNDGNLSSKNITLCLGHDYRGPKNLSPGRMRLLFNSDATIGGPNYYYHYELYWDLVFAFPERTNISRISNGYIYRAVKGKEDEFHLVFGKNQAGNTTDLFLPGGEAWFSGNMHELGNVRKLRSLSFDIGWLKDNAPIGTAVVQDLSQFALLENLEELYFSDCRFAIVDMSFLKPLASLKHLQIPSVDRNAQGPIGFDVCPSLESITLLGKPDTITIKELQNLPNLKKLVVADVLNENIATEKFRSGLKSALPNVESTVVAFGEYKPIVPKKFRKHLEETKAKVLEKLRKQAEADSEN